MDNKLKNLVGYGFRVNKFEFVAEGVAAEVNNFGEINFTVTDAYFTLKDTYDALTKGCAQDEIDLLVDWLVAY